MSGLIDTDSGFDREDTFALIGSVRIAPQQHAERYRLKKAWRILLGTQAQLNLGGAEVVESQEEL